MGQLRRQRQGGELSAMGRDRSTVGERVDGEQCLARFVQRRGGRRVEPAQAGGIALPP